MAAPMAAPNDLINFDVIETHKENIQSLPGGRSAKQLAAILSPLPSARASGGGKDATPTLNETKTLNDAIRQEYEIELQSIADSDDPLDIYDRYVKWTLNAYPSAQATPQSQLLPLLERATKAFLTSSHYKNDPRYLKLWLHYIRLFSDSPRETFAFLARHGIGEGLGLFYEEFAAWLEGAGRWMQADEVYKLGMEREARPAERLLRKYNQFQQRFEARPPADDEPSSPALPTVRPALAAKVDPFASSAHHGSDSQPGRQQNGAGGGGSGTATSRSGKPKMAIFSDADSAPPPTVGATTKGWDSIGSMQERKKENTVEARPWAGEKLKAGGRVGTAPKMEIFKDPASKRAEQPTSRERQSTTQTSRSASDIVNPRTGRVERVFANIDAVYPPNGDHEFSFEELRAMSRGWSERDFRRQKQQASPLAPTSPLRQTTGNAGTPSKPKPSETKYEGSVDVENLSQSLEEKIDLNHYSTSQLSKHDVSTQSMVGMPEPEPQFESQQQRQREKRTKIREVRQETQTVKTRLESPTGKKLKRKNSSTAEPTMTFHSKAATNEIYDMFNQPLRKPEVARDDTRSGDDDETDFTEGEVDDDGYSTTGDGESTGTGRVSVPSSEFADDDNTLASLRRDETESQTQSQIDSVSPWSDFTASKHMPHLTTSSRTTGPRDNNRVASRSNPQARSKPSKAKPKHVQQGEDMTESMDSSSQNATQTSGLGPFDTQAIAAIANGNFDDMDTKAIAMIAGDLEMDDDAAGEDTDEQTQDDQHVSGEIGHQIETQTTTTEAVDEIQQPAGANSGSAEEEELDKTTSEEDVLTTPMDDVFFSEHREIRNKPLFVPIPPEDYEPTPIRPLRDPAMVAQNKLPFMTPIVERTESSIAPSTVFNDPDYFNSKTPSRSPQEEYDTPSRLTMGTLTMGSPHARPGDTPSSSAKRRFGQRVVTDEDEVRTTSSPQKKVAAAADLKNDDPTSHSLFSISKSGQTDMPTQRPSASPAPTQEDDAVFRTSTTRARSPSRSAPKPAAIHKGPVIVDLQCNPCDDAIRQQILSTIHPPMSSYVGYHDHAAQEYNHYQTLKTYADKLTKGKGKTSPRKSVNDKTLTKAVPPILKLTGSSRIYAVKRQLGEGAFAPVYLVESYDPSDDEDDAEQDNVSPKPASNNGGRQQLEALKTEAPPGTLVWEFHVLRLVRQRLGHASRTMQSIMQAHECHLYRDEAYLVLSYSPHGTLLDLVNLARSESVKAGKPAEGLDEVLAMWFSVELLRTLEDLHGVGILHGDLKGDNCLVRFDPTVDLSRPYDPQGESGWQAKGLTLIDLGRGIDVRMFHPAAQFIADWPSYPQDCAEIRECRPWKWQIDYHGAAGVIHSLLFGKYIETVPAPNGPALGQKKEWRLKDNLKRYWEKELWTEVFGLLLNPASVAGEEMPIQNNLRRVRVKMENWLKEEGERGGRDLRGSLKKMERLVCAK